MSNYQQQIEAVLYLKGQPMTIKAIAEVLNCSVETAEAGLIDLINEYAHRDSALEIEETPEGFVLKLRSEFMPLVQRVLPTNIGKGALRTLAVIALKNPISQADLVELRGSAAYQHIQELVEQGFVKKRRQADGRSYWLQVTDKFRQYFAINDLSRIGQ